MRFVLLVCRAVFNLILGYPTVDGRVSVTYLLLFLNFYVNLKKRRRLEKKLHYFKIMKINKRNNIELTFKVKKKHCIFDVINKNNYEKGVNNLYCKQ